MHIILYLTFNNHETYVHCENLSKVKQWNLPPHTNTGLVNGDTWIGLTDLKTANSYTWADGTDFNYTRLVCCVYVC